MEKTAKQKACPECGSTKLVRDYERAELVCAGCGFVIHDKIMDMGPEWRAFDQEQRDRRGRVGAPMTLSVDYSEPIIVEKNGQVKIMEIGKFVDSVMEKVKVRKIDNVEIAELSGFRTVSFDDDFNVGFRPISHVSRHEVFEDLYEVKLETGRKITVTGAHSLFTVRDKEIRPIRVDCLKNDDFIVVPRYLPTPKVINKIDLLEEFATLPNELTEGVYVRPIDGGEIYSKLKNKFPKNVLKNWKRHDTLPLHAAKQFNGRLKGAKLGLIGSANELPVEFPIDEDICRLMGYYVSEGSVRKTYEGVQFSFGGKEHDLASDVKNILQSKFRINPTLRNNDSEIRLEARSRLLGLLLANVLGAGTHSLEKRVPPLVFSLPDGLKLEFLRAYVRGDGNVYVKEEKTRGWRPFVQVNTVSANSALSNDIMFLYLQLGALSGYREEYIPAHQLKVTGQFIKESILTGTRLTNPDAAVELGFIKEIAKRRRKGAVEELVPAPAEYRKLWKSRNRKRINRKLAIFIAKDRGDEKLLKLAESPLAFLRVKKIKKVRPTSRYAYDLSVPGCENFLAGVGGIFAHNTIHDKGLSTMIDWRDRDSHGKDLTPKRRAQIYRLRKWQRRIRVSDATERNLAFALSEIDRMASHLALPRNVREAASLIYRKAVEERLIRGRSIEGVAAAALYAACRECKVPRTLDEIADVSRVSKKEIGRSYRFIARELLIHLRPTSPTDYIPRFGSELGLSGEVQSKAIELLKEATKKGLTSGRGPTGVAAAAIYIASVLCGERRTQRDVADVARVTEVTVRNRYKELCEKLGLDVEL